MEDIKALAMNFRTAIERAKENGEKDELGFFQDFPLGCCGDASDLLAQYLFDNGIKTFQVQAASYKPKYQSHAWLSTEDNLFIDITGDQFKDNKLYDYFDIPVYVGFESNFHKKFQDRKKVYDCELKKIHASYRLINLYNKIIKYI